MRKGFKEIGTTKLVSKGEQFLRNLHTLFSDLLSSNGYLDVDEKLGKELKKLKMIQAIEQKYELTPRGKKAFTEAFKELEKRNKNEKH